MWLKIVIMSMYDPWYYIDNLVRMSFIVHCGQSLTVSYFYRQVEEDKCHINIGAPMTQEIIGINI